tara:strand:+ start:1019 stop:1564 length:546 start_codon:yes stop_codon:yes gene_type:complete
MIDKLVKIQSELKAPKNQRNNFGKYNYRSCEDILEAVKPLLAAEGLLLTISDEIMGQFNTSLAYVEATAMISDGNGEIVVKAQAGIDPNRKGMDIAQSFGSSSSYARKYALNGLFLIDDTKDSDATNTHGKQAKKKPDLINGGFAYEKAVSHIKRGGTIESIEKKYTISKLVKENLIALTK